MDRNIIILNGKERKPLFNYIREQWGVEDTSFLDQYAFRSVEDDRLYFVNKEVFNIDISQLRIDLLGTYFGEWRNNELRVSIEASQIIGKYATKNIIDLSRQESRDWLRGLDFEFATDCKGFVLVKSGDDFMGCGRIKEGRLLNFVSKIRRLNSED